jgi:hypothetical protein
VKESERKILLTSDILADEYGKLFNQAIGVYRSQSPILYQLIEGGEQATTPDGLNSFDYNDQLMSIIDYMNEFISTAVVQYQNTLKFAQDNDINNDAVLTTQDRMFNLGYESGTTMLTLSNSVGAQLEKFETLADTTGDPKYQLGIVFLYDQKSILNDYAANQLSTVYETSKEYEIKNVWTNLILAKLVELNPADYLGDFPKEIMVVQSNPNWVGTTEYDMNWINSDFNTSNWKNALAVNIPATMIFPGLDSLTNQPVSVWLYTEQSGDSAQTPEMGISEVPFSEDTAAIVSGDSVPRPRSLDLEEKEIPDDLLTQDRSLISEGGFQPTSMTIDTVTAYFRHTFNISERVINGWVLLTADNVYHFYLNGEYIKGDDTQIFESVDRVGFIEFGDFLQNGENVIAIDVTDNNGLPNYGLRFHMQLEMLPVEITAAADRIRRQAAENVDENRLKTIVILNKNRVPVQ